MPHMEPMPKPRDQSPTFCDTELHSLLARSLGHLEEVVVADRIVPAKLAKRIGCCRYTVYRWLGSNRISPKGARNIMEISGGRLTREDFAPFLIL